MISCTTGIFTYAGCNAFYRVLKHEHSAKQALPSVTLGKPTFTANCNLCRQCLTAKRRRTTNSADAESRSRQRGATWHARPQQMAPSVTAYITESQCTTLGKVCATSYFLFLCVFFPPDMWSHWSHLSVKVSNNLLNIFEKMTISLSRAALSNSPD